MNYSQQGGNRSLGKPSKAAGLAVTLALVLYAILAPRLNQQFGWTLPTLEQAGANRDRPINPEIEAAGPQRNPTVGEARQPNQSDPSRESDPARSAEMAVDSEIDQAIGWLEVVSAEVYRSPAGLVYGPGSAEGHRLTHVGRHAADIPDRPGPHGVFDGGLLDALKIIDEAWNLAKQKKQTTVQVDGQRTIYRVDLKRKIGFVGGSSGNSRGHPPTSGVQLVLEGNRVITAYPVESQR
jgi:hypothetical protein